MTGAGRSVAEVPRPGSDRATDELDEAYERLAGAGFEFPNGFVNHGAMACEALVELGFHDEVVEWGVRFARGTGAAVDPVWTHPFDGVEALGDYRRLPEWIGYFQHAMWEDGWKDVAARWTPRLMPGLATALFHGAIRAGHAVRAISVADTPARRHEMALAFGYWAARYHPGQPLDPAAARGEASVLDIAQTGAEAARYYLETPNIFHLHGVTGAMAVQILAEHLAAPDRAAALAHVRAEHAALFSGRTAATGVVPRGTGAREMAAAAQVSGDPHQVKLLEACVRGSRLTGNPAFLAAAEVVTRTR